MSLEHYRTEDFDRMKQMEKAIIAAILPFSGGTDPVLGLLALMRCARVMLRAASREAQKALLPVLVVYLSGRTGVAARKAAPLLWTPDDEGRMN